MKPAYECPNTCSRVEITDWLSFAQLIAVDLPEIPFTMKGIHSQDSVIVVPVRKVNQTYYIGIIKEQRLLFHRGWLSALPAGKKDDKKTPEEAAKMETLQEAGLLIKKLIPLGSDMPFLHICDEEVHFFAALVDEKETSQSLEEGEIISDGITWLEWHDSLLAIQKQLLGGPDFLPEAKMAGVSLYAIIRLFFLYPEPEMLGV